MLCPVCNGDMYDNRTTKKNPKGPDYRCKDKNCKYQLDQESGEYVESQYGTGVWLKKTTPRAAAPVARPAARPGAPVVRGPVPEVKREMVMSYAKDLVVAQIQGGTQINTPVKSIIFAYRLMLKEVQSPGYE